MTILDEDGQIIQDDFQTQLIIQSEFLNASIVGESVYQVSSGVAIPSISVIGDPGSMMILRISDLNNPQMHRMSSGQFYHRSKLNHLQKMSSKFYIGGGIQSCDEGYNGPICQQCIGWDGQKEKYYAKVGQDVCEVCGNLIEESFIMIAIMFSLVLYFIVLLQMLMRNPSRKKDHSVLFRILTNYFQEILMARDLNLDWPQILKDFFQNFTAISSTNQSFIKVNCLFQSTESLESLSKYVFGMLFFSILPIVVFCSSFLIYKLLNLTCFKGRFQDNLRNTLITTMVFIFLVYPTISSYTFGMFSCITIEGVSYLTKDFDIECWSSDHYFYIYYFTLPVIIIWVIGYPLFIIIALNRNKKRLNDVNVIKQYGLYYIGFKDNTFYWQIGVINIRRIIYIAITVSLSKFQKQLYAIICVIVIYIYMQLVRSLKPYESEYLNQMDSFASLATSSTIIFGLFFLDKKNTQNQNVVMTLFSFIVVINCTFFIYWLSKMAPIVIRIIRGKIEAIHKLRTSYMLKRSSTQLLNKQISPQSKISSQSNGIQKLQNLGKNSNKQLGCFAEDVTPGSKIGLNFEKIILSGVDTQSNFNLSPMRNKINKQISSDNEKSDFDQFFDLQQENKFIRPIIISNDRLMNRDLSVYQIQSKKENNQQQVETGFQENVSQADQQMNKLNKIFREDQGYFAIGHSIKKSKHSSKDTNA
eukprot:403345262